MDVFTDYNGYYVALIIITIITIAIGIALSFYFIFIPSIRLANQFDSLEMRGLQTIQSINNLIGTSTTLGEEVLQQTCESLIYAVDKLFGKPRVCDLPEGQQPRGCILDLWCINQSPFIPNVCQPFITDIPTCCLTIPDTCPGCVPPT